MQSLVMTYEEKIVKILIFFRDLFLIEICLKSLKRRRRMHEVSCLEERCRLKNVVLAFHERR